MKVLAIALAFGDLFEGAGEGELIEPLDGGISRFEAVKSMADKMKAERVLIVCTAGFSKKSPRSPVPKRQVHLAGQLARWVKMTHAGRPSFELETPAFCWGSEAEVREGIRLAGNRGFREGDREVTLVVATYWAHMPRVWLYCMLYKPSAWRFKARSVKHNFPPISYLHEAVASAWDFPRISLKLLGRFFLHLEDEI